MFSVNEGRFADQGGSASDAPKAVRGRLQDRIGFGQVERRRRAAVARAQRLVTDQQRRRIGPSGDHA